MPHQQDWLIENNVVFVAFSGKVTPEDIGEAFQVSAEHVIASTEQPVHFLHNWTAVDAFPTSLNDVFKQSKDTKAPLKKIGWVVAYGNHNRLFRFMGGVFFQLFGVRFRLLTTADEAIDFLCKHDPRLDKQNLLSAHTQLTETFMPES